ncbi:MAG TPA: dTDP-4-dehydrorhamnose 3,5-epimerase [Steroidobacteraceae bacterium]|nr:dTDP-4-dehydrorhamnose 3,5-epimerase [Steroidobacteraceae bacterium]
MTHLRFIATPLEGLRLIERHVFSDHRGRFARLYCAEELKAAGITLPVAQINHSYTAHRGAVRGLHFQHPPHGEDKIITCLRGEVFDVAIDLRRGSPTLLRWHGELLSAANARSLLVPQGFAHGFQALSDDCELLYLHTRAYAPEAEDGVNARDPAVAIAWPLPFSDVSERDAARALLPPGFPGI